MSTRTKPQNLVNKNEINCKASRPIDSFKCKNCDDEFASSRSYDSHRQHRNGVAGEPPAGASLTSSLREEARWSPWAASPPLRARRRRRPARASCAEEAASLFAPIKLFIRKRVRPGLVDGGSPRLSLLRGSPYVASHAAFSSFQTVGCIMRIEMRGGRFAAMNQANQILGKPAITFAWPSPGRADLNTGILRQHSLANAKLGESFTLHIFAYFDQITQINTIITK